eukprot:5491-Heterococcus_DN1.PRE.2
MPSLGAAPAYGEAGSYSAEGFKSTKAERIESCHQSYLNGHAAARVPPPYTSTSDKEALCLQYIDNFREQFVALYPDRKQLFLTAPNEYGITKFVCGTLRPTELPYREVYNLDKCCEFVANFLHYEPLDSTCTTPACLPSPTQVLGWQVAYGTAPYWITTKDQSNMTCPLLDSSGRPADGVIQHENGVGISTYNSKSAKHVYSDNSNNDTAKGTDDTTTTAPVTTTAAPAVAGDARADAKPSTAANSDKQHNDENNNNAGASVNATLVEAKTTANNSAGTSTNNANSHEALLYTLQPRGPPQSKYELYLAAQKKDDNSSNSNTKTTTPNVAEAKHSANDVVQNSHDSSIASSTDRDEIDKAACYEKEHDVLYGKRVHAWVIVRPGKRSVNSVICIEPTTGRQYSIQDTPYMSLEAVFNASNFWVSMQSDTPLRQLNYDLLDNSKWEFVFIDESKGMTQLNSGYAGDDTTQLHTDDNNNNSNSHDILLSSPRKAGITGTNNSISTAVYGSILDLPQSWVSKLTISRDLYLLRYPRDGRRTLFYSKAKVDMYGYGIHDQGVTVHVTLYSDTARTQITETREIFSNRRDKLHQRVRSVTKGYTYELFLPGRHLNLKECIEWIGHKRVCTFYSEARLDGLKSRTEVMGVKIIELFEGRQDKLIYRSINVSDDVSSTSTGGAASGTAGTAAGGIATNQAQQAASLRSYILPGPDSIATNNSGGNTVTAKEQIVHKMTEKYARDYSIPAHTNVAKRTYYVNEGRIRSLYHYANDRVTRVAKMYWKDNRLGSSSNSGNNNANTAVNMDVDTVIAIDSNNENTATSSSSDTNKGSNTTSVLPAIPKPQETLQDVIACEKECFITSRHLHIEMLDQTRTRHAEELAGATTIVRPIIESARDRHHQGSGSSTDSQQQHHHVAAIATSNSKTNNSSSGDTNGDTNGDTTSHYHMDYLTPFIQLIASAADHTNLTKEESVRARDACLRALKDRLLERANIINTRLNEENALLSKRQAAFQRNQRDNDNADEDAFEKFCAESMFRIQILEQRLVQHEETALKKYSDLDSKLANDPRLSAIKGG